jgi:hypothetical protein
LLLVVLVSIILPFCRSGGAVVLQGIDNFFPDDFFRPAANAVHPLKNPNLKEIQTFGEES